MSVIKSYRDLRIWQNGIELVKLIYLTCRRFPKIEIYGLTSQMQRAAISIPSNIAEGHNRLHQKEFSQFLNIALGSCAELETQTLIAKELSYLAEDEYQSIIQKIESESRQIRTLLEKVLAASNQRPATSHISKESK